MIDIKASSTSLKVIMQAQEDAPADFANCKDKFMVQMVLLRDGEQLGTDTFNKDMQKDAIKESRLRVVLRGPETPPSPAPDASIRQGDDDEGGSLRVHTRTSSPAAMASLTEPLLLHNAIPSSRYTYDLTAVSGCRVAYGGAEPQLMNFMLHLKIISALSAVLSTS